MTQKKKKGLLSVYAVSYEGQMFDRLVEGQELPVWAIAANSSLRSPEIKKAANK